MHDPEFTDELATRLFDLTLGSRLSTAAVTREITRAIVRWARDSGCMVRTEARVEVGGSGERQLGFVDVLVCRGGLQPDVAIEIDSTDKPWSVVKLQHAVRAGMHAIWVRWGDDEWAGIYDGVDVIQLRLQRHVEHRAGVPASQMALWK